MVNHLVALGDAMTRFSAFLDASFGTEEVPARPGVTISDLVQDVVSEYRWTISVVMSGERVPRNPAPPVMEPIEDWFASTAAALIATFQAIDLEQPTPNFTFIDERAHFWLRRQAHVTTLAAVDAASALGLPPDAVHIPADFAADGITELVQFLYPWMTGVGIRPDLRGAVRLHATDLNQSWIVLGADDAYGTPVLRYDTGEHDIVGELSAPAAALYLGLWKRVPPAWVKPLGAAAAALVTGPSVPPARF